MLAALSTFTSAQTNGTETTADAMVKLLNYCITHRNYMMRYTTNDRIVDIHRETPFLYKPKARIRVRLKFLLTNKPKKGPPMINNGAVHVIATIIHHIVSSASETEVAALSINEK